MWLEQGKCGVRAELEKVQRSGRVRLKKRGSRVRAGREDLQLLSELAVLQPLFAQPVLQDGGEC